MLPIALNTRIKQIRMSHNKIRVVDASFQFYEHLVSIDLSNNIIEDIEDKSFAAQVLPLNPLEPPASMLLF